MKQLYYEKMESMFPLIQHEWRKINPLELVLYQLARGNTFNMRVIGLEDIKHFRKKNPDCSITFKPNHLSEADFILLSILFRENDMQVPVEGGANLFIDDIDVFKDLLPAFVNEKFKDFIKDERLSIAQYLTSRGAFKVFREPTTVRQPDGSEINLGRKDIISLTRAYRYHLVKNRQMYVTFPGYSTVKAGLLDRLKKDSTKTGRSYTGKVDGFHHLPFLMDIEASLYTETDVYIVDVNIAYERVLEDENFAELTRLYESGTSKRDIYIKDLGYILKQFCSDKIKGNLSIKFGQPRKIDRLDVKESFVNRKIKSAAHSFAQQSFEHMLSMQPVYPANIYFTAFNENFERTPVRVLKEKINGIRDYLNTLAWGSSKRRVDLHYVNSYNQRVISADEIINRALRLFSRPNRHITDIDGDMFVVYNRDVAQQYRNHTAHFFADKNPR
jgi:glycerol-3-phosphate O-acyltransferase